MSRTVASLPARLEDGFAVGPGLEVAPNAALLTIPNVARYLVLNGTSIDVAPAGGSDPDAVNLFLDSSARGVLIHQRGEVPLEATTVKLPNGPCIALSGFSGIGKSTVAAAFIDRGASLVSDGITRVTLSGGRLIAWPSHSTVRLWKDACERLEIKTPGLKRVRNDMEKFYVPVPAERRPVELSAIIRLQLGPEVQYSGVAPDLRTDAIVSSIFRKLLIELIGQVEKLDRVVQRIETACQIAVLSGAREGTPEDLYNSIIENLP